MNRQFSSNFLQNFHVEFKKLVVENVWEKLRTQFLFFLSLIFFHFNQIKEQ